MSDTNSSEVDQLSEIRAEHEHSVERTLVQEVSRERRALTCHECEGPIAEGRHDGYGWRSL